MISTKLYPAEFSETQTDSFVRKSSIKGRKALGQFFTSLSVARFMAGLAGRVYVTAFPNFQEFKRHIAEIAWETEVWLSEISEFYIDTKRPGRISCRNTIKSIIG